MTLSIIIVNYKTPDLTLRCLDSIYRSDFDTNYEIIVVDNDSQDDSRERILEIFPSVIWLQNSYNAGFGRANNLGVAKSKGRYILLLNSDMVLLPDTLSKALAHFTIKDSGILGCQLLNEDGSLQNSVYFDTTSFKQVLKNNILLDLFIKFKRRNLDAVMGSFFMLKSTTFKNVGGFDPDYFMYAEELDLAIRVRKSGLGDVTFYEGAVAIHKHGGSSNSEWSIRQTFASTALFYLKRKGLLGYFVYLQCLLINFVVNGLFLWKMDKPYRDSFKKEWRAHANLLPVYLTVIPIKYGRKRGRETGTFLKVN